MALIKCVECGNGISDKAAMCPACGHPIGNSAGSAAHESAAKNNIAFEKRIEQYIANGYNLVKRESNSVTVSKLHRKAINKIIIESLIAIALGIALIYTDFDITSGHDTLVGVLIIFVGPLISCIYEFASSRARISISTIGKIEETGNVLKH